LVALTAFSLSLFCRTRRRNPARTPAAAVVLGGVGLAALVVGNYLGGHLVYRQGMWVSTGP
jgi:uncharacterized membrane protein